MLIPLNQLESHLSRPDQSLMYHMILQQQETNRLLTALLESKPKAAEIKEPTAPRTPRTKRGPKNENNRG